MNLPSAVPRPQKPLPIVMIGAGGIVHDAHLPAYAKAGFPVHVIADLDVDKAQGLAEAFGVGTVVASVVDAVAVAPADAVYDLAVPGFAIEPALNELPDGAAVLIQKPLGEDLAMARRIRDLCARKHLMAGVNFQLRYAPCVVAARALIASGGIGDLVDIEVRLNVFTPWHLFAYLEGLPRVEILYHSVHYIDLIRSFAGNPTGIHAKTQGHPKAPGIRQNRSTIIMDYGEDLRATITANHGHAFGPEKQESYIKWEGTRGAITARLGLLLDYPRGKPDRFDTCRLADDGALEWQEAELAGTWFPDAFIGTMGDLMRWRLGEIARMPTHVDDATVTMACVEAVYISSASGGTPIPE